jgi:general secretion pathway protein J
MNPIKVIKLKSITNPKGFTLLEVLIAMFIFSVVLSTLYTVYTGTFRNIEETESQADLYQMARIVLERMTEDLESVYIAPRKEDSKEEDEVDQPTRFVGTMTETEGRRLDTLRFASKAHIFFDAEEPYAGTAEIVYYIREDSEKESFTLYRSDKANLGQGQSEETGTGGWILCDRLHALRFIYYDEEGVAYDGWDSTGETFKDKLPSGVSIVLELANGINPESAVKFITGVTIPMSKGEYGQAS